MKNLKKLYVAGAFAFCNLFGASAHAGIPVIDAAALVQDIQQVLAWGQQYSQMYQQYQQMVQQYTKQIETLQNFTGSRGMSALASDTGIRQALPSDFMQSFDQLRTMGAGGANGSAKAIYDKIKTYGCSQQLTDANQIKTCEAIAMSTPTALAMLDTTLQKSQQRAGVIQGLISQIDGAADAKAAADLGNRIQSEMSLLQNEKLMMDMAIATQTQQLALVQQQRAEAAKKRMVIGGTNPFNGQ